MRMFDRILLASDFSPPAAAALLYAAACARLSQARLLVLHVMDTRLAALPHWTDIFRSIEVFADREATINNALQRLRAHPALAGLHVDSMVQHGTPREHIVDAAANVDLVVMGLPGRVGENGKRASKIAPYVAHSSPTPVLFVPEGGGTAGLPSAGAAHPPLRHLLLAVHFANYAPHAITLAQQLAASCQATLQALQVFEPDKSIAYPLETGAGLYHNRDAMKILLRKRLAEILPDDPRLPAVQRLLLEGDPAEVIVQQSLERRADLVVMSAHAYGFLHKFFTVSTVDTVLEQTACPLLVVPLPRPATPLTTAGIVASCSAD
jgi:nucleotide-binding universal stress UspA family protein